MRKTIIICAVLLAVSGEESKAQLTPGMIDMQPSINTRTANMNGDFAMEEYNRTHGIERERINRLEAKGSAIIKARKATTTFASTLAGTQEVVGDLDWTGYKEQDLASRTALIERYVKIFDRLAAQNGFIPGDIADGYTFAAALSYAAYHDKDMDKTELAKFRQSNRQYYLTNPGYQGSSDKGKQWMYERNAAIAAQAIEFRARARRATSDSERREFEAKAKRYAGHMLSAP